MTKAAALRQMTEGSEFPIVINIGRAVITAEEFLKAFDYYSQEIHTENMVVLTKEGIEFHRDGKKLKLPNPDLPADVIPAKEKRPAANRKKLDDGKMLALRKAGWTYEKIADEMGCSPQTVINHIKEKE